MNRRVRRLLQAEFRAEASRHPKPGYRINRVLLVLEGEHLNQHMQREAVHMPSLSSLDIDILDYQCFGANTMLPANGALQFNRVVARGQDGPSVDGDTLPAI